MMCEMIDLNPGVSYGEHFKEEAISGLLRERKAIPPKFLYDRKGSEIFERICALPEYYPTRKEREILGERMPEIVEILGNHVTLVEFGSGASVKTRLFLQELADPCAYVPIDISREFLMQTSRLLASDYRGLPVIPVWADYTKVLHRLERALADHTRKVAFFPGSTIGNMEPWQALDFLKECSLFVGSGGKMIVGFDLIKPVRILEAAYNDSLGVTAEFDLNLLERMNRELGANFDLSRFKHHAFFNPLESRIEMHLMSLCAQQVRVGEQLISFDQEETLHTESSYKYTLEGFAKLAEAAHFQVLQSWSDSESYFAVVVLEARPFSAAREDSLLHCA